MSQEILKTEELWHELGKLVAELTLQVWEDMNQEEEQPQEHNHTEVLQADNSIGESYEKEENLTR